MSPSGAPTAFRLIVDPPRAPTLNMAIDEALAAGLTAGSSPIIRFYAWSVPAVTIGYFQRIASAARLLGPGRPAIVRRLTGGGLVRHDGDLTFSLILPGDFERFRGDVKDSYLRVSEAVREGLKDALPGLDYYDCRALPSGRGQGERVCFEEPACYDLLWHGRKVLGASQRRFGVSTLHQSSVRSPLEADETRRRILDGFHELWEARYERLDLTAQELAAADRIAKERYASEEWADPVLT